MIISRKQLVNMLHQVKHAQPVTITTVTNVDFPKNHALYKKVQKITQANVFIGFDYANSLKNLKISEPVLARKWGAKINNTPLIMHKNEYYLETRLLKRPKTEFLVDGLPPTNEQLTEINNTFKPVDQKIKIRDYSIHSIISIKINKNLYTLI